MIVLAHVFMLPVEEVVVPIASGVGAGALLWLTTIFVPLRRRRRP
jgi:hypothetical protein